MAPDLNFGHEPVPRNDGGDLKAQVEALGGLAKLDSLGWPVFVPAFAEDYGLQLYILEAGRTNASVDREVAELVRKCGGYVTLANQGVTPEMGLNLRLEALRRIKQLRDQRKVLNDPELNALAMIYGADLHSLSNDTERLELLTQVKDHHRWTSDSRNRDAVNELEGKVFFERRQVQLTREFAGMGGANAYERWIADHPADSVPDDAMETKLALLRSLREYNRLGGEEAYRREAAGRGGAEVRLSIKLAQLKAIRAINELGSNFL
jgi:hypothetical protein